jgi:hypothetical protein
MISSPETLNTSRLPFLQYRVAAGVLLITAMLLCSDMVTGPLRFYLSQIGLSFVVYVPKVLSIFIVLREVFNRRINRVLFFVLLAMCLSSVIGMTNDVTLKCILFSFFSISPFLVGISSAPYLLEKERQFVILMSVIFIVTAVGVFLAIFIDFPWKGFVYTVDNHEIEGVREWSTFGIDRVAGFARMSVTAAFYLLCSSLFLFSYCRSYLVKSLIVMAAFPLILATTNKAGIFGFLLGMLSIALTRTPRLQKVGIYCLVIGVVIFPFTTLFGLYNLNIKDPISLLLLASFEDRLINTWPMFIAGVSKFGSLFAGVGFGGIGASVKYFVSDAGEVLNFADNFLLYLYGIFGVLAIPLFIYFGRVTNNLFSAKNRFLVSMAPVIVATLGAALTTDVIEVEVLAVFLGMALSLHRYDHNVAVD